LAGLKIASLVLVRHDGSRAEDVVVAVYPYAVKVWAKGGRLPGGP